MNMKHNKFLMVSVGFLFFGAQHLSADPVSMGFDGLQAQAQNSLAATRAQFQWQEPFSEEAQLSTPQKSTATRKSADMPAVENQWQGAAIRGAACVGAYCQQNMARLPQQAATAYKYVEDAYDKYKTEKKKEEVRKARNLADNPYNHIG